MELLNKKLLFLGDSITQGVGVSCEENRFTNRISALTGAICVNYGIGGTRIAKQAVPSENPVWDQDFISRVDRMDTQADAVVVFGGTNDWGHGDAPFGTMDSRDPYTFYGALHTLYQALIEKYPASHIVIVTPLHRRNETDPAADGNRPNSFGILKDYVNAIREVAEYYSLPVLDLFKTSGMQPAIPIIKQNYMPDGLHPNDDGHEILADKILRFLQIL